MINVGDRIKLNEELCPLDKRGKKDFQFGKLGYFVAMLDWELEVINTFEHSYNGTMLTCKVLNNDAIECDVIFRADEVVSCGASKFHIDYEIIGSVKKNQDVIDRLTSDEESLIKFRSLQKSNGSKISDLKSNWNEITKVRLLLKKELEKTESVTQVKTKQGVFTVNSTDDEKIKLSIRNSIRSIRRDRKEIKSTTKKVAGNLDYQKVGGVLAKAGTFTALNEKFAIAIIKEHKTPRNAENCVGIELEMLCSKTIDEMNKEFIKARLHRYVNLGTDGSIRTDLDTSRTMELRILVPESQLGTKLKEICEVLRKNDCYSNRSCGMHVHLDMRNRNPELCYSNLFKLQDLMLSTQPITRRSNSYCKPNINDDIALSDFQTGERYKAINTDSYSKHKTIEIRLHDGATKFRDVYNWAKFLVDTVNQSIKFQNKVSTIVELERLDYVDSKIISHLDERIQEYAV